MAIEVTCRIGDSATRPGQLNYEARCGPDSSDSDTSVVTHSWTLDTRLTWDEMKNITLTGDALVGVEIWLPDSSAWTGKAYATDLQADDVPVTAAQHDYPVQALLTGTGRLTPKA